MGPLKSMGPGVIVPSLLSEALLVGITGVITVCASGS